MQDVCIYNWNVWISSRTPTESVSPSKNLFIFFMERKASSGLEFRLDNLNVKYDFIDV